MTDDELLSPKPSTANDALKADLFAKTSRRLTLARWQRRGTWASACIACFGLGLATTFLRPTPEPEKIVVELPSATPVTDAPSSPVQVVSPAQLELEAEQILVKAEAARRFREAGDLYLRTFADHRSALRCYRNFLDEADPADRAISNDDTWLLTSLKRAREQENAQ